MLSSVTGVHNLVALISSNVPREGTPSLLSEVVRLRAQDHSDIGNRESLWSAMLWRWGGRPHVFGGPAQSISIALEPRVRSEDVFGTCPHDQLNLLRAIPGAVWV